MTVHDAALLSQTPDSSSEADRSPDCVGGQMGIFRSGWPTMLLMPIQCVLVARYGGDRRHEKLKKGDDTRTEGLISVRYWSSTRDPTG